MQTFWDYLQSIILFGLLSLIVLKIANGRGFFILPVRKTKPSLSFKSVGVVFSIYLFMTLILSHLIFLFFTTPSATALSWIQLFLLFGICFLLFLYAKANEREEFKLLFKDRSISHSKPLIIDFAMGVFSWLIAFPLVLAVSQLIDMLLYYLFNFQSFEQVAVRYLKNALQSPGLLTIALVCILIFAPIIEEFLFRGCLQTYFKRYMTRPKAIFLSSLFFALFHYAGSQGIGNISLVASLFTFALFLGFIYERQASLCASIGLHMTFNTISTIRILFFPDAVN